MGITKRCFCIKYYNLSNVLSFVLLSSTSLTASQYNLDDQYDYNGISQSPYSYSEDHVFNLNKITSFGKPIGCFEDGKDYHVSFRNQSFSINDETQSEGIVDYVIIEIAFSLTPTSYNNTSIIRFNDLENQIKNLGESRDADKEAKLPNKPPYRIAIRPAPLDDYHIEDFQVVQFSPSSTAITTQLTTGISFDLGTNVGVSAMGSSAGLDSWMNWNSFKTTTVPPLKVSVYESPHEISWLFDIVDEDFALTTFQSSVAALWLSCNR